MNEPLHPSTLGEILDRTAHLYRSRFLLFLGISVIPTGMVIMLACGFALVVSWWSTAGSRSVSSETGFVLVGVFCIAAALVALPIFLAAKALSTAAMNHAASRIHMGETTTIRDAYKTVWRRGWRYLWLCFLQAFIVWIAPIAAWFAMLFLVSAAAGVMKAIGMAGIAGGALAGLTAVLVMIALTGYGIWMLLRLSLAFPSCVIEQTSAWKSLKRSSVLSSGTKGRILLLYLLGAALGWLLSIGVILFLTILLYLIPGMSSPQHAQVAAMALLFIVYGASYAVQSFVKPVFGIALVLFYYDQRIRQEGFDIEWMMQQAGMIPELEAAPLIPAGPLAPVLEPSQAVEFRQALESIPPAPGESL